MTNKFAEHSCRKHDWIYRDTNKKIQIGKGYLCNIFLSDSKIFYKHDHKQHTNDQYSESGIHENSVIFFGPDIHYFRGK